MKTLAFTLAFILCAWIVSAQSTQPDEVAGQGCLPEGITFESQEDVDNFQVDYPGCTEIEGDVTINDCWWPMGCGEDITNLDGLSALTSIGGNLAISGASYLGDLSGLAKLTTVTGNFSLHECPMIMDLTGFESLSYIGGELRIEGSRLTNLSGLESVTHAKKLIVSGNALLDGLTGIENLETATLEELTICDNGMLSACDVDWICGYLMDPPGSINIYNNAIGFNGPDEVASGCGFTISCLPYGNYHLHAQSDVYAFPDIYPDCGQLLGDLMIGGGTISDLSPLVMLSSIGGSITIDGTNLSDLHGLENLASIGGDLNIRDNNALQSLANLENLATIDGNVSITRTSITSLDGLKGVTTIDSLVISDNDKLPSLTGLDNLMSVSKVEISQNWLLEDLSGLENIAIDNLVIYHNLNLTSLAGLEHITSINNLDVSTNIKLESLTGLENLTTANYIGLNYNSRLGNLNALNNLTTVAGNFSIQKIKYNLENLSGLDNLTSIGGNVEIYSVAPLTSLAGLESLSSIGGMLRIDQNHSLKNINALVNLVEVNGNCLIKGNYALTSLSGLENVEASSIQDLYIVDNSSLSTCHVKSVCDYLSDPGGLVVIHDNKDDCYDQAAVEAACGVGIDENKKQTAIQVTPNPVADGWATFTFNNANTNGLTELRCFNAFGQEVHNVQVKSHSGSMALNTRDWKTGIYLVVLYRDGRPVGRAKFVVQQ